MAAREAQAGAGKCCPAQGPVDGSYGARARKSATAKINEPRDVVANHRRQRWRGAFLAKREARKTRN
eukprot:5584814-Alexandrium_andersonii.AAC.1